MAEEASHYQKIKIFDTVANGRVMVLDDIVQITTRDESAYAEMLTHLPLLEHGKAERVMIVGGGDLSIADEALKHKGLKEVVLVDIDDRVIELCRKHFGAINAKAFKDKRLNIEVADAFEYLGRPAAKRRFDLIVADRPDPVGPGKALFGDNFYSARSRRAPPGRLCHVPDRRAVLPAVGDHRRAQGAEGLLSRNRASTSPWCPPMSAASWRSPGPATSGLGRQRASGALHAATPRRSSRPTTTTPRSTPRRSPFRSG